MLRVAILGGSGYTGGELFRLLSLHPNVKITAITSEQSAGKNLQDIFPNLRDYEFTLEPLEIKSLIKKADLFLLCLPHKTSQEVVSSLYNAGKRVIDLSADYRLTDVSVYEKWYETPHKFPEILKNAVYGLPELYRQRIKNSAIIANPGCYPSSAILALAPIMNKPYIDAHSIIIDSKSGVSGAGRSLALPFMYCETNESIRAYSIASHRHTPEIEQELSILAKTEIKVIFTPHLVPMDRGILSTIYVRLKEKVNLSDIHKLYMDFYREEPFVRVLKKGIYPTTKAVRGTNYCDISVFLDEHHLETQVLIIVSAIDNLLKGASGQAVQNMNIMYGFKETTGLTNLNFYP